MWRSDIRPATLWRKFQSQMLNSEEMSNTPMEPSPSNCLPSHAISALNAAGVINLLEAVVWKHKDLWVAGRIIAINR